MLFDLAPILLFFLPLSWHLLFVSLLNSLNVNSRSTERRSISVIAQWLVVSIRCVWPWLQNLGPRSWSRFRFDYRSYSPKLVFHFLIIRLWLNIPWLQRFNALVRDHYPFVRFPGCFKLFILFLLSVNFDLSKRLVSFGQTDAILLRFFRLWSFPVIFRNFIFFKRDFTLTLLFV